MGFNWFSKSSFDDDKRPIVNVYIDGIGKKRKNINPDPNEYEINWHETIGRMLLVQITYLNCTNFEGKKILVFEHTKIKDLKRQKAIDPHFSSNKDYFSPVARFEPTKRGQRMARSFCHWWEDSVVD